MRFRPRQGLLAGIAILAVILGLFLPEPKAEAVE